jgi:hypothetical protein
VTKTCDESANELKNSYNKSKDILAPRRDDRQEITEKNDRSVWVFLTSLKKEKTYEFILMLRRVHCTHSDLDLNVALPSHSRVRLLSN